ncbi:hypothetical protein IKF04_02875 [Candidatus Saccharibacteria bacterium]|nr:hypothetical protein [Candidatus Saccharibacteria bacterium]
MGTKYKNEDLIGLARGLYSETRCCFDESTFRKRFGISHSVISSHFAIRLRPMSGCTTWNFVGYNYLIADKDFSYEARKILEGSYWSNFMTLADIPPYARSKESVIEEALRKIPKDGSRLTPLDWNDSLAPIIRHFGNSWDAFVEEVERAKKEKDTERVEEKKESSDSLPEEESLDDFVAEIQDLQKRFKSRYPNLVLNFSITNKE